MADETGIGSPSLADFTMQEQAKQIANLRAQLEQAQEQLKLLGDGEPCVVLRFKEYTHWKDTIARQRAWIEKAGHRPGCAALSCNAYSGLCGLHEKNDFHCDGLPEFDHKFQAGPCDCGWAELVGGRDGL